jgi:RNA polymerase sigma factor (sigma-70 family)
VTDEAYNIRIGEFLETNWTRLTKAATDAAWAYKGIDVEEGAHEILMGFVDFLYQNKPLVMRRLNSKWMLNYALTRIWLDKFRYIERFIPQEYPVDEYDENWSTVDNDTKDAGELTMLQYTHIDCDRDALKSFEVVRSMHSQGFTEIERDQVALAMLAAQECLDGTERMLFKLYFREQKSYRTIAAQLGIPKSAVQLMVKEVIRKIKERVNA